MSFEIFLQSLYFYISLLSSHDVSSIVIEGVRKVFNHFFKSVFHKLENEHEE